VSPRNAVSVLGRVTVKNRGIFDFEKKLAKPSTIACKIEVPLISPQAHSTQEKTSTTHKKYV
jgi:hypothetical protein